MTERYRKPTLLEQRGPALLRALFERHGIADPDGLAQEAVAVLRAALDRRGLAAIDPIGRFEKYVERTPDHWLWTGSLSQGYGAFYISAAEGHTYAHRFSYELYVGPIPDGLHIDHLCRRRDCVRPDHLEAVTQAENNRRAWSARSIA